MLQIKKPNGIPPPPEGRGFLPSTVERTNQVGRTLADLASRYSEARSYL